MSAADRERIEATRRDVLTAEHEIRTVALVDWQPPSGPRYDALVRWAGTLRDAASQLSALSEALSAAQREQEMTAAQLRGWRDFFSGQPSDLPYRGSTGEAKETQLNVAWAMGYSAASESDLWKLMVARADRSAEALTACQQEREKLHQFPCGHFVYRIQRGDGTLSPLPTGEQCLPCRQLDECRVNLEQAEAALTACRAQGEAMRAALACTCGDPEYPYQPHEGKCPRYSTE